MPTREQPMTNREFRISLLDRIASAVSDDPDTQTSAILITRHGGEITNANVIPNLVKKYPKRMVKPEKYKWIMHAERAVLAGAASAGVSTWGSTMYVKWFPCSDCAQMIVHAGVRVLDADKAAYKARKDDPKYGFDVAMEMLTEAGVEIRWH